MAETWMMNGLSIWAYYLLASTIIGFVTFWMRASAESFLCDMMPAYVFYLSPAWWGLKYTVVMADRHHVTERKTVVTNVWFFTRKSTLCVKVALLIT